MKKVLEFGRKAMFYVRVLSGYEERRIRSYRLQLEKRLRLVLIPSPLHFQFFTPSFTPFFGLEFLGMFGSDCILVSILLLANWQVFRDLGWKN